MGLSINTTPARIAIERVPGHLEIQAQDAKLELRQKPPVINITTEQPRIIIDQYQCFAEEGLKNNIDLLKEQTQYANQNVMQYIAKKAQDGDAMAKIGHKANIMIDNITRDSVTTHEFGMGTLPMSRPYISAEGGTVTLEAEPRNGIGEINGVTGNFIPGELSFDYTPSTTTIKMQSYGSIDIKYTGKNVDSYI